VHQVGDQPRLYYDAARSTSHQDLLSACSVTEVGNSVSRGRLRVSFDRQPLKSSNIFLIICLSGDGCL